jgi:hypothetical protein
MFELDNVTVRMTNFNARSELNGDTRKPAADISFSAQFPSTILDELIPGLLDMLYMAPKNPDLAEQADPTAKTALRIPELAMPLKLTTELENRALTIDYGLGGDSNIVLPETKAHKFTVEAHNGGTVTLGWQMPTHPDAAQAGWLYEHQQTDIVITVKEVKAAGNQESLLNAPPPKQSKKEKQAAALAEAQEAFEKTAA